MLIKSWVGGGGGELNLPFTLSVILSMLKNIRLKLNVKPLEHKDFSTQSPGFNCYH